MAASTMSKIRLDTSIDVLFVNRVKVYFLHKRRVIQIKDALYRFRHFFDQWFRLFEALDT
jgi:hypothetical protein